MSFEATSEVWEKSARSGSYKLVLLCIAHHQNSDIGKAWPSVDRIATMCSLKRRQVFDILRELCASGDIKRESGALQGKVNRYSVNIAAGEGVRHSAPHCAVERTPTGATDRTPPVRPSAPKSLLKESSESSAELKDGRSSAAMLVADLVLSGLTSEVAEQLLAWHASMGKRSITTAEFEVFASEVGKAPGYTINEVAESISVGEHCRYLPSFNAKFLPQRSTSRTGGSHQAPAVPSRQRKGIDALEAMKRPEQRASGADDQFGAAENALDYRGQDAIEVDELLVEETRC